MSEFYMLSAREHLSRAEMKPKRTPELNSSVYSSLHGLNTLPQLFYATFFQLPQRNEL